jgi:hypothetical protein
MSYSTTHDQRTTCLIRRYISPPDGTKPRIRPVPNKNSQGGVIGHSTRYGNLKGNPEVPARFNLFGYSTAGKNWNERTVELLAFMEVTAVSHDVCVLLVRYAGWYEDRHHRPARNVGDIRTGIVERESIIRSGAQVQIVFVLVLDSLSQSFAENFHLDIVQHIVELDVSVLFVESYVVLSKRVMVHDCSRRG